MNPQTMDDVERSIWTVAYGAAFVAYLDRSAGALRTSLGGTLDHLGIAESADEAAQHVADRAVAMWRRSR